MLQGVCSSSGYQYLESISFIISTVLYWKICSNTRLKSNRFIMNHKLSERRSFLMCIEEVNVVVNTFLNVIFRNDVDVSLLHLRLHRGISPPHFEIYFRFRWWNPLSFRPSVTFWAEGKPSYIRNPQPELVQTLCYPWTWLSTESTLPITSLLAGWATLASDLSKASIFFSCSRPCLASPFFCFHNKKIKCWEISAGLRASVERE